MHEDDKSTARARIAKAKRKTDEDAGGEEKEKARRRAPSGTVDDDEDADTEKARGKKEDGENGDVGKARGKEEDAEEDDDVDKVRGKKDDDEEDDASKKDGDEDEDDEDTAKARRASDSSDDDEDEAADTKKAARRKTPSQSAAGDADEDDDGDDETKKAATDLVLAPSVRDGVLRVLTSALERLMAIANRVKEADAPDDESEPSVPRDLAGKLEDVCELLEDAGERLDGATAKGRAKKGAVKKAGARMARDRLDRFQKALELLGQVLKELTDAKARVAPSAGNAEKKVEKSAGTIPGIAELVASVGELTRVVKRQEHDLAQIRKTRGTSNAIPVDGGRRVEPADVAWPLDMNRPISRSTVTKAKSFYDAADKQET